MGFLCPVYAPLDVHDACELAEVEALAVIEMAF